MTPEEVAEAYGKVILDTLNETATVIPATSLLQFSLVLQEKLEALTQTEPTARPAALLTTKIARFARLANETIVEHQRTMEAEAQRRIDEVLKRD
jgi:hypothetical protein